MSGITHLFAGCQGLSHALKTNLSLTHPKPQDLQFGRDDEKYGIFKWKMWDGTVAEFYSLEDDPFSLPLGMVKEYKKRIEQRQKARPIWLKGFKKISRC